MPDAGVLAEVVELIAALRADGMPVAGYDVTGDGPDANFSVSVTMPDGSPRDIGGPDTLQGLTALRAHFQRRYREHLSGWEKPVRAGFAVGDYAQRGFRNG